MDYTLHYRRLHQFTDDYYAVMAKSYRRVVSLFPQQGSILDIGCGAGFLLNALRESGHTQLSGIDLDHGQIELARKHGLNAEQVDDVASYLRGRKYRAISLIDVLEHVPKTEQIALLGSIRDALEPAGVFICQVPNAMFCLAPFNLYMDWTHHCLFTVDSFQYVLENAGFTAEIREGHNKPSPPRALGFALQPVRFAMQKTVELAWRFVTVAYYGPKGLSHPICANLLAVCHQ